MPPRLSVPSLVAGLAIGVLGFFAMAQRPASSNPYVAADPQLIYGHPRSWVQIPGGAPYAVPPGKLFVLTALGGVNGILTASLSVDGQQMVRVISGANTSMVPIPSGLSVGAGKAITLANDSSGEGWAWGYLVDA